MSLTRELDYLEGTQSGVDLLFIERVMRSADSKRFERVSVFVHSAAARGWRVRLKALREHPSYSTLISGAPAQADPPWASLSQLTTLKGGLNPRERPKAQVALPWYKIAHFHTEAHMMQVKRCSEHSLKITPKEEHGALKPYDILALTKGGQIGFYLRPHTLPISAPRALGELTHTSFIKLSAEHLDPRLIHPAYLVAYLTSAEGLRALSALQALKNERQSGPLDWSLSVTDLSALQIPIPSPFRQALMISAWALRVELQRQQRRYLDAMTELEARRVSELRTALPLDEPPHLTTSEQFDPYDQLLSDLVQPFDDDGPLRPLPLDEAPLFPTLGRQMTLRALTRHLMGLPHQQSGQGWRALNVMTIGHLGLLSAQGETPTEFDQRDPVLQRALNHQCVGLCSAALTQLNRHLLVTDAELQLPRHNPEPWFHFTVPTEGEPPDLLFVFWGHSSAVSPSLGEAREACDPLVSEALGEEHKGALCSVLKISINQHFVERSFYAHTLGGYLNFEGWELYVLIYRVLDAHSETSEPTQVYLSTLDRLCQRASPPKRHLTPELSWSRPLKALIESLSPKYSFHLEHLTELRSQLTALTSAPH